MIVRRLKVPGRWPIGVAIIGVCWLPTGCGTSAPPPPSEPWVVPSTDVKGGGAPAVSRKKTAKEEDAALSGRERRALLKQSKSG